MNLLPQATGNSYNFRRHKGLRGNPTKASSCTSGVSTEECVELAYTDDTATRTSFYYPLPSTHNEGIQIPESVAINPLLSMMASLCATGAKRTITSNDRDL